MVATLKNKPDDTRAQTVKRGRAQNYAADLLDEQLATAKDRTVWESGVDSKTQYNPWNPDDLYQKRGDYSIYENMVQDDQVSVALQIKKDLVIGSGWQIHCDTDEDLEVRKNLEHLLQEKTERPFEEMISEMLTAYEFGFSISEKQFAKGDDNEVYLKDLKTRDPVTWLLHQDKFGKVVRYEQQGVSSEFSNIDPNSLIHYVNNPRFSNPYGTSDLRPAYLAYFIKTQIVKYYAIFTEKAASPIPYASYDGAIAKDDAIDDVYDALKRFQNSTALVFPKEFDVNFLETSNDGTTFINGITMMNMFIGRALFVPDLLGFQGGPTTGGSQALGREQMVIFFKHIMRRRRILEDIINKHIIQPLVFWNWGFMDHYPKFKLKPIESAQAEANAKLWLEAVKGRAFTPSDEEINYFKSIVEFPVTDGDDEQDPIDDIAQEPILDPEAPVIPPPIEQEGDEDESVDELEQSEQVEEEFAKKVYDFPKGDYHKKVDFKSIETQLSSSLDSFAASSRPIIDEIINEFTDRIAAKQFTANTLDRIENLKLKSGLVKKLQKAMDNSLYAIFEDSKVRAKGEIFKSAKLEFAVQPEDAFLKTLEAEDFNFVKDWEYNITKAARIAIINAVKDGLPISTAIEVIKDKTKQDALVATERYARTKLTEVMNKGRVAFFKETGVVSGYQYSAVLDDRTSEICEGLHGKIFKAGEEPTPPMHFNCRSVLVPITIYEEFEPDDKVGKRDINEFIESARGEGFPKN